MINHSQLRREYKLLRRSQAEEERKQETREIFYIGLSAIIITVIIAVLILGQK